MRLTPTADVNPSLLKPNERVLSTLQADGSRRWLHPRLAKGNFWNARRLVAYFLIAIYATIPYLSMNGHPLILLDIVHRRFHIFGVTFLPTDTKLLALLLLMVGLTIFTATAIMGRVFCGWACPQTVYLEFVFRPIERLFTGTTGRGGKAKSVPAWRRIAMYAVYLFIAVHLAHTLLAYFIGANQVHTYIWNSTPFQHPAAFIVVALATAWIMWDFAYWREQMCIIGCPYGRMQSVLLDRNSMIVSYDYRRGEPRGKGKREPVSLPVMERTAAATAPAPTKALGDCIDCSMCVQVCPTGIDIRDGLQLECVNCTQCIDACNSVMDKAGLPRGLIGYSSQNARAGEKVRRFRPRVFLYPTIITLLATLFVYLLLTRNKFDLTVLRNPGKPFNVLADGRIENTIKLKIVNRADAPRTYKASVVGYDDVEVSVADVVDGLKPLDTNIQIARFAIPPERFTTEHLDLQVRVESSAGETQERFVRLLGPMHVKPKGTTP